MKHHPTLFPSSLSPHPLSPIHRHCLSLLRYNPRPRHSPGEGRGRGKFPFHLVFPISKIPTSLPGSSFLSDSVASNYLPPLSSRAPLPETIPLRFTVLGNPASHPRTAPRNRSPSQPASQQSKSADGEQLLPRLLKRDTIQASWSLCKLFCTIFFVFFFYFFICVWLSPFSSFFLRNFKRNVAFLFSLTVHFRADMYFDVTDRSRRWRRRWQRWRWRFFCDC